MPLVSVTRLRIRSWRYLPAFAIDALRSSRQAQRTPGFAGGWLGFAPELAFWTVTVWRNEASMRAYRDKEAHKSDTRPRRRRPGSRPQGASDRTDAQGYRLVSFNVCTAALSTAAREKASGKYFSLAHIWTRLA